MANKMGELVGETEQRDAMVAKLHEEAQLQIVLLQHQVLLVTRTLTFALGAKHTNTILSPQ